MMPPGMASDEREDDTRDEEESDEPADDEPEPADDESDEPAPEESDEPSDEADEPEESGAEESEEPASDEADEPAEEPGADGAADGETPPEASPWQEKVRLAHELWEAGDNARLRRVIAELSAAPEAETEARTVAADYAKRLRPDPVAIALWALSLGAFCLITYLFVLR
jgi:hypothetical protein